MSGSTFGEEMKRLRDELGLSLRDVGEMVHSGKSHISNLEHGRATPDPKTAALLDEALKANGALLRLAKAIPAYQGLRVAQSVPFNIYSYVALSAQLLAGGRGVDPMDRRGFMALGGAAAGGMILPGLGLETTRHAMIYALAEDGARAGVDEWRAKIHDYGYFYFSEPPKKLMETLEIDNVSVTISSAHTTSEGELSELRQVAAVLAALTAMTQANLGNLMESRRWWRSARSFAALSGHLDTELWVRGRQIIRALYEQHPVAAILALADETTAMAEHGSPKALTELTSGRAQALALAGRHDEAVAALRDVETLMDRLPDDAIDESPDRESLLIWRRNRYEFTASYTWSHLGMLPEAEAAQNRALASYSRSYRRGPVQIELQRALCLVRAGDVQTGVEHARQVMSALPRQDHIRPIVDLGDSVYNAVPARSRNLTEVDDLRNYLSTTAAIEA